MTITIAGGGAVLALEPRYSSVLGDNVCTPCSWVSSAWSTCCSERLRASVHADLRANPSLADA